MRKRYVVFGLAAILAIALAVPALGGPSNPIATTAASVKSTAKKALKKAKKANTAAKNAQATANDAAADANSARQTANTANTKAEEAGTAAAAAQTSADAAAAAAAAAQTTADSKYGDVTFRSGTATPVNSANKTAIVSCASGEELASGGWTTTGAGSNDITPTINSSYLNAWIVGMEEIGGGTAETWGVTATMICIDQT